MFKRNEEVIAMNIAYYSQWDESGFQSKQEYELWSPNLCGMACLKMVLKDIYNEVQSTVGLAKRCCEYGGYIVKDDQIEGLIYKPFCKFIKKEFGLSGKVKKRLSCRTIKKQLSKGNYIIASVNPTIRDAQMSVNDEVTIKGGHLVLMTGFNSITGTLQFHNPSGNPGKSQINHEMLEEDFNKYFANRGIVVYKPQ